MVFVGDMVKEEEIDKLYAPRVARSQKFLLVHALTQDVYNVQL